VWRWRCAGLVCLWLIDVTNVAGAAWVAGGQVNVARDPGGTYLGRTVSHFNGDSDQRHSRYIS